MTATDARGKVSTFTMTRSGSSRRVRTPTPPQTFYFYDARSRLTKDPRRAQPEHTLRLRPNPFDPYPYFGSTHKERGPNEGAPCRSVDGSDDPFKADAIMNCCKGYKGSDYTPGFSDCHNLTHSCITGTGLKNPGAPGGRFGQRCVKCSSPPPSPKPGSDLSPKCWGGGARGC